MKIYFNAKLFIIIIQMQILRQQADERRLSRSKVGTVNSDSLNYNKHIPAFDSSNMPTRAKGIRSDVKLSVLPDILAVKPAKWNPSVLLDKTKPYDAQVSTAQLHLEIRKGLRDSSHPPPSRPKLYEGVDTRNRYVGWDVSVQYSSKEHKLNHFEVNAKARHNSATRSREILERRTYTKPFDRQVQMLNEYRAEKEREAAAKAAALEKVLGENPDISRERALALAVKALEEKKEKGRQEEFYGTSEEIKRAESALTVKRNLVRKAKHDGVFLFNEHLGKTVWSCCVSEEEQSPGCVVSYKDKDKWQLVSI